jgi:intracellular septation protein
MKVLVDFLPIALFVLVYKFCPELLSAVSPILSEAQNASLQATPAIIIATAVLIPATLLQMLYTWVVSRTLEKMHIITFVFVFILGGLTIIFQDKTFIQWKPTLVNGIFALLFLGSHFIGEKPLIERMLSANLNLPKHVWLKLSYAWVAFFIVSGLSNLYVAYHFSEDIWVDFKLFGLLGLTIVFIVLQGLYLSRYLKEETE